jgi:hypothetical protein
MIKFIFLIRYQPNFIINLYFQNAHHVFMNQVIELIDLTNNFTIKIIKFSSPIYSSIIFNQFYSN